MDTTQGPSQRHSTRASETMTAEKCVHRRAHHHIITLHPQPSPHASPTPTLSPSPLTTCITLIPHFLAPPLTPVTLTPHRFSRFKASLFNLFESQHSQSLSLEAITANVSASDSSSSQLDFSREEVAEALDRMQEANQVMVSEGVVFLI